MNESDKEWVLEEIDPDWRDHFPMACLAFDFYWSDAETRQEMLRFVAANRAMSDQYSIMSQEDPLRAATGIIYGLIIALVFWGLTWWVL